MLLGWAGPQHLVSTGIILLVVMRAIECGSAYGEPVMGGDGVMHLVLHTQGSVHVEFSSLSCQLHHKTHPWPSSGHGKVPHAVRTTSPPLPPPPPPRVHAYNFSSPPLASGTSTVATSGARSHARLLLPLGLPSHNPEERDHVLHSSYFI